MKKADRKKTILYKCGIGRELHRYPGPLEKQIKGFSVRPEQSPEAKITKLSLSLSQFECTMGKQVSLEKNKKAVEKGLICDRLT